MSNLGKIFKLVTAEERPCFISSKDGESVLVIMPLREYEKLRSKDAYEVLAEKVDRLSQEAEALNRQITAVQKESVDELEFDEDEGENPEVIESLETVYIEPLRDAEDDI